MAVRRWPGCARCSGSGDARSDGRFDYELGNPWILLALVLPILGVIGIRRLMRQPPVMRWPAMKRVSVAGNRVRPAQPRKLRPTFLVMAAIALAIVAAARPQWGEHDEAAIANTREVIVALDLSRSILTEDIALPGWRSPARSPSNFSTV